ncbi:hypothetical protein BsWGS_09302 [Bradybaena similaris]
MEKNKQPLTAFLFENTKKVEHRMVPDLSVHQKDTGGRGSYTLPHSSSPSAAATFAPPEAAARRQSVPTRIQDSEQLEPLLTSGLLVSQIAHGGGETFRGTSTDRASFPYTTRLQHSEEAASDKHHSQGHTANSSTHLEPVFISGSAGTPLHQPYGREGNQAFATAPHQTSELSSTPRHHSATILDTQSSPSHRTSINESLVPDFTPRTTAKQTFNPEGASSEILPHQSVLSSSSSSTPTTLQYSRTPTDSLPSTSAAVRGIGQVEPYLTTCSSHSGSGRFSDKMSHQTSASYATSLHHAGLTSDPHPSPTHTAELMLAGGLPKNRRRPGASSPDNQHVTMRGTITRGNSVGQPVKVQLDLTETEFLRLTSHEPLIKEDFKCGCASGQGPHIILWSLLCIPVAIAISLTVAFYNGSMAWYNLIIYFSEEKTFFHKVALCPLIILTFPITVGISAVLISLVAAAMQISWSWHRWLAEIRDGEKGFYGWFCAQIRLPKCSPYQVVVLDSSSV